MTKPRCVITGSCYGLGQSFLRRFEPYMHVIEYDLALGQDLNQASIRDQVIEDLRTCTVFFNNCQVYQEELLTRSFLLQNNLCIVNSSSAIDYYVDSLHSIPEWADYLAHKQQLNQRVQQLHNQQNLGQNTRAWILNLRMSWLATEEHCDRPVAKLSPDAVADLVYTVLTAQPRILVQDLLLTHSLPLG
jgi:hypothetical protein